MANGNGTNIMSTFAVPKESHPHSTSKLLCVTADWEGKPEAREGTWVPKMTISMLQLFFAAAALIHSNEKNEFKSCCTLHS